MPKLKPTKARVVASAAVRSICIVAAVLVVRDKGRLVVVIDPGSRLLSILLGVASNSSVQHTSEKEVI